MKILILCSINSGKIAPYILEQAESLKRYGCEIDYCTIEGKGSLGYLKNRRNLIQKIKTFNPEIIHAHYGLSGLLANLQRKVPVVTTYHGSDINNSKIFYFSKFSIWLSKFNIFVSQKNIEKVKLGRNSELSPCGVDLELFKPLNKKNCRKQFGFSENEKIILFAGSFSNKVKNHKLAQIAVNETQNARLIELRGYNRRQVCELINAVDVLLMTSFTEGSPQVIKEAMACNCPIVSVDVGDVEDTIKNTDGCYVTSYKSEDITECLERAFSLANRTDGRKRIMELGLDLNTVAGKMFNIYQKILNNKS